MKMKSPSQHSFAQVPQANIPRSAFKRDHAYKTTFDAGWLIPFYVDEALPGDTHKVNATLFARLATPIVPIMDNLYMDTFYFAVPLRLIWDNFQKFMGERTNPDSSIDYLVPTMTITDADVGSLHDYFGLPTDLANPITVSSFWHRAYNLIYNEWFRDQNIQNSVGLDTDDGPDDPADYVLLRRGKRHDYFTSALPWPQKGDAINLPLGDTAPVVGNASPTYVYPAGNNVNRIMRTSSGNAYVNLDSSPGFSANLYFGQFNDPTQVGLEADLSAATAATINSMREAFQLQRMLEKDARGGTRYTEVVRSHFGVTSPDARLQRPEFLGGNSSPVIINAVQQTSETTVDSPQGNLAAFGTVASSQNGFTKSFTEHCVIIGLVSVRADLTYQQGIPRMFSRSTRYDFYWPSLAHLGEQEVLNKEIYAQGTSADDEVFGYQERYAEYRYYPSKITGALRSTYATSLDVWHLSQEFSALPTLSPTFIVENPPVDRVIAVDSEPHFIFDSYIQCKSVRPMPVYSVPGLIDHF